TLADQPRCPRRHRSSPGAACGRACCRGPRAGCQLRSTEATPEANEITTVDVPDANRLTLDATLAQRGDLRHTPAGIPAIDCTLQHESVQAEAGGQRKVDC